MNVPPDELNRWRAFAEQVRTACFSIRLTISKGQAQQAKDKLEAPHEAAITTGHSMDRAGADRPGLSVQRHEVPLALLDTPANRRYAEKLREAWEAGLAVDRERYGEDIGTDGCAQIIEMVLADVEQECFGAMGRVQE